MRGAALELIALTKAYGATLAVDRVDLRIDPGTYCCLLGSVGLRQDLHVAHDRGP